MENKEPLMIPYVVYESTVDRYERKEKRSHILTVILTIALVLSILGHGLWLYMWNQYDYVDDYSQIEVESTDGGDAYYQQGNGNTIKE